jgi:hypothetical protein
VTSQAVRRPPQTGHSQRRPSYGGLPLGSSSRPTDAVRHPASPTPYGNAAGQDGCAGGLSRIPRPRKGPVTPRYTGQSPKAPRPSPGAWHAACGTFAHGRAACWSEHRRIGQLARSSSQRGQISLIWTTAPSTPRGLAPAQIDGSGSQRPEPLGAPGVPNARPDRPTGCHGSTPREHFGRGPVEISLISAVRTHALCVHTQDRLGGRHRRASRRGTAAHLAHLAARTLRTHAYAGLIRPREKAPTNPDLRRHPERETAGHSVVHTHGGAINARTWWRGQDLNPRPSGYEDDGCPGRRYGAGSRVSEIELMHQR